MATRPYSVFISYASGDRPHAERLFRALQSAGVEVWLDTEQLRGGEAWDEQIRQRVRSCTFFLALVSPLTDTRAEGYFRREWRMALDRMSDLADDRPFLVPVALEGARAESARVPAKFLEVQWLPLGAEADSARRLIEQLERLHDSMSAPRAGARTRTEAVGSRNRARAPVWRRSGFWLALAAAAGAMVFAGLFLRPKPASLGPALDPQAVAVIPFANHGGAPSDDYLCDGLTEEVTARLMREPSLHVVARSSAASLPGKSATDIGAALRVGTVVRGEFRRSGDEVTVQVRVLSGADGELEWSRDYTGASSTLMTLESALADDVAGVMAPHSMAVAARAPATTNLDAYDAFLHGASLRQKASTKENIERAAAYYRQAVTDDPRFALAWARYGILLIRLHNLGWDDSAATLREAHHAIAQALAIQPDLPEAHVAMASYLGLQWADLPLAVEQYQQALALSPNDDDAWHGLAVGELILGRKAEAVRAMEHAVALDPRNAGRLYQFGIILAFASRYDDAMAAQEGAFALDHAPDALIEEAVIERERSGNLSRALAKLDTARRWCKTAEQRNEYWRYRMSLLRSEERWPEALAAVDQMEGEASPAQWVYYTKALMRAQIRESMGDEAQARRDYAAALGLTRAYAAREPALVRSHTTLALIEAALNQPAAARADVARCLELVPPDRNPYLAALTSRAVQIQVEYRLGAQDRAFQLLSDEIAAGFYKRNDLLLAPEWRLLQSNPRFQTLAKAAVL